MKFLCLIHYDEAVLDRMPDTEREALIDDCIAHNDTLRETDNYLAAAALEPARTAAVLRVQNGKNIITDGPFAETKEQLGGFLLLEANDIDQAVAIAAELPVARLGALEVRPVKDHGRDRPRFKTTGESR